MGLHCGRRSGRFAWTLGWITALSFVVVSAALAAPKARLQGKVIGTDTGEPVAYANVVLFPADTTLPRVGGRTNTDGTFLIEAAPGRYRVQVQAMSYTIRRFEAVELGADQLVPLDVALKPEAILQEQVEVTEKAVLSNEAALLSARKKATAVGDAISAEQVRKSPDRDAAEVLKRVTGLNVSDGKYVFVRGMGERYSSVEVDGVRIASPEQNKRVVPLDLVPAPLLDNIVVQKTYTADRPGEFGGGDVQVRTKDFPGKRTWQVSAAQGFSDGVTFKQQRTYQGSRADIFGFGSSARQIPQAVYDMAGDGPLRRGTFTNAQLAETARSFSNIWGTKNQSAVPNLGFAATYGNELKLFGRPFGVIASGTMSRSFDYEEQSQRYFQSSMSDTLYDYDVVKSQESVQLGGIAALSYRLSPRHTLHLRGLFTNDADDEVRQYQGLDHNRQDVSGDYIHHRDTRLMYVQRNIMSGTLNGQHAFTGLLNSSLDWKLTRSSAHRNQPDRREYSYDRNFYPDADGNMVEYWALSSSGNREYGELSDNGWGGTAAASVPYRLPALGNGKVAFGYDRQVKTRDNFYRRFAFEEARGSDTTLPPDSLFAPSAFPGTSGTGFVEEATLEIDNYEAHQRTTAGYVSVDLPLGSRVRSTLGVRVEKGYQDVRSFDLFEPTRITSEGTLDDTDWLPSGNVTWAVVDALNLRLGASRTVSRPDLNELSPSPALEYIGGFRIAGNPDLERALVDNYDARVEAFPGIGHVVAAGVFYKKLHQPIEQAIQGGTPPLLVPRNSDQGKNLGLELEARFGLAGVPGLKGVSINSNATFIDSEVRLKPEVTRLGSPIHPLQGQANYLVNAGLGYVPPWWKGLDLSVLVNATGKRLRTLAYDPLPDIYDTATNSLDANLNIVPFPGTRIKLTGRNLLDPEIRSEQGGKVVSTTHIGRTFAIALTYGS